MLKVVQTFIVDESGATAVEYGLIAVLISVAITGALKGAGISISAMWDYNTETITGAIDGP